MRPLGNRAPASACPAESFFPRLRRGVSYESLITINPLTAWEIFPESLGSHQATVSEICNMAWTAPKLEEVTCGMEINMYFPAEDDLDLF
jgi:coenzyme PQQ precursor peptide PqqA